MGALLNQRAFVESWLERRAHPLPPPQAARLAEAALRAAWRRSGRGLGDTALRALAGCALDAAAREFPLLAQLRLGEGGFDLSQLARESIGLEQKELALALERLLVELLIVVNSATGGILAPALCAELSHLPPGAS